MEVKAYAKINLALEVMDEKNGYHMVNNLMILTDLYDTIILEKADDILLENNMIDDNIMIKAAKLFLDHFNISSGVHMKLIKRIPVAAGLAGGSTDAASVLKGLNSLYNVEAPSYRLHRSNSLRRLSHSSLLPSCRPVRSSICLQHRLTSR